MKSIRSLKLYFLMALCLMFIVTAAHGQNASVATDVAESTSVEPQSRSGMMQEAKGFYSKIKSWFG